MTTFRSDRRKTLNLARQVVKPGTVSPARQEKQLEEYIDWLDDIQEELVSRFGELGSKSKRFLKGEREGTVHRLAQLKASLQKPPDVF